MRKGTDNFENKSIRVLRINHLKHEIFYFDIIILYIVYEGSLKNGLKFQLDTLWKAFMVNF